jgi:uncharacterized protein YutE (UPF0331/DUF86 family)
MDAERHGLIQAEVRAQLDEIDSVYQRIDSRRHMPGEPGVESLSYQLHNLYSAFEDLFHVIAEAFENNIAVDGGFHIALLKRMMVSVPGVRPALIDREAYELLDSLRGFRHFFRHAYGTQLDPRKVRIVLEDADALRGRYKDLMTSFLSAVAPE